MQMPRSPFQSDFTVEREPVAETEEATQASARSTKIVMTFTWIMLAVLALICAIGPHIPSGE